MRTLARQLALLACLTTACTSAGSPSEESWVPEVDARIATLRTELEKESGLTVDVERKLEQKGRFAIVTVSIPATTTARRFLVTAKGSARLGSGAPDVTLEGDPRQSLVLARDASGAYAFRIHKDDVPVIVSDPSGNLATTPSRCGVVLSCGSEPTTCGLDSGGRLEAGTNHTCVKAEAAIRGIAEMKDDALDPSANSESPAARDLRTKSCVEESKDVASVAARAIGPGLKQKAIAAILSPKGEAFTGKSQYWADIVKRSVPAYDPLCVSTAGRALVRVHDDEVNWPGVLTFDSLWVVSPAQPPRELGHNRFDVEFVWQSVGDVTGDFGTDVLARNPDRWELWSADLPKPVRVLPDAKEEPKEIRTAVVQKRLVVLLGEAARVWDGATFTDASSEVAAQARRDVDGPAEAAAALKKQRDGARLELLGIIAGSPPQGWDDDFSCANQQRVAVAKQVRAALAALDQKNAAALADDYTRAGLCP